LKYSELMFDELISVQKTIRALISKPFTSKSVLWFEIYVKTEMSTKRHLVNSCLMN
jgi:hypothetical protein